MALRPSPTVDWMAQRAQRIVDRRLAELDASAAQVIIERRETRSRNKRVAQRHEAYDVASLEELRAQGRRLRDRAHRTVMGTTEPLLGAPRSGSA
jgi:hypothetical protein